MQYVGSTLASGSRGTFWARSPSFVLTWPALLGLLLLLLIAGAIALVHHLRPPRRRLSRPLHGVSDLVP
jgi:hypothetical protein